ncbi:MAG: four helix bundle protein [Bacteroidales bacterium]|nr:four helix bundle protein [Bacteroidales bacterium]
MNRLKDSVLHNKSLAFGVRIIKFYQFLCDEKKEYVLSKQILRSGTAIGANCRECRNAQSNADFSNKLSIALKEADETQYWLELFLFSGIINQEEFDSLNKDVSELVAILTTSIKTIKTKTSKN